MPYEFPHDVRELIDRHMATGMYASEEDALHAALHALTDYRATVADIRQGMVDYEQKRGQSLSRAMAHVRWQLGFIL